MPLKKRRLYSISPSLLGTCSASGDEEGVGEGEVKEEGEVSSSSSASLDLDTALDYELSSSPFSQ
jgi:hypothetical protein